jgi:hypothetical protein
MVDLYELKLDSEKIEELLPILRKLDEIIALLPLYGNDEALAVLKYLSEHKNDLDYLFDSVEGVHEFIDDFGKGTFNGKRKLDIDLSLNKRGIKESGTAEATSIWANQQTTVYYSHCEVMFNDGVSVTIPFVNDDNEPVNISTASELSWQLKNNNAFKSKLINTSLMTDAFGKVDNLLRIVDLGSVSNFSFIKLYAVSGDFVLREPVYLWSDTTSVLITLFEYLSTIQDLPTYTSDEISQLFGMKEALTVIMNEINGLHTHVMECGWITDPIEENESVLQNFFDWNDKALIKANNLSDIPDKQAAVENLGINNITVEE